MVIVINNKTTNYDHGRKHKGSSFVPGVTIVIIYPTPLPPPLPPPPPPGDKYNPLFLFFHAIDTLDYINIFGNTVKRTSKFMLILYTFRHIFVCFHVRF